MVLRVRNTSQTRISSQQVGDDFSADDDQDREVINANNSNLSINQRDSDDRFAALEESRSRPSPIRRRVRTVRPPGATEQPPSINIASRREQQQAFRNLVTGADPERGDSQARLSAGLAGTTSDAVSQRSERFSSVSASVPGVGRVSGPNFGDQDTAEAARRFFNANSQSQRNADPTRVAFQNRFQLGESLREANDTNTRRGSVDSGLPQPPSGRRSAREARTGLDTQRRGSVVDNSGLDLDEENETALNNFDFI